MALTEEQARVLAELQAQRDAPEPRTDTGLPGILHALLDVVSGAVPHLAGDVWAALHRQAEDLAAPAAGQQEEPGEPPVTESSPAG